MVMQSINPATEEIVETFEEFSAAQIDAALQQAHDAQKSWRETSFGERAAMLQSVARILRARKTDWATLATLEMGKPLVEAEAEVEKCAWNCDFYAEQAPKFLADEHIETGAQESFVAFEPLAHHRQHRVPIPLVRRRVVRVEEAVDAAGLEPVREPVPGGEVVGVLTRHTCVRRRDEHQSRYQCGARVKPAHRSILERKQI